MTLAFPSAPPDLSLQSHHSDADWLNLTWLDGQTSRYPTVWLRDNVPSGRHRLGGQRTFDIIATPQALCLAGVELVGEDSIALTFQPEGLSEVFSLAWLRAHRLSQSGSAAPQRRHLWDQSLQARIPQADFTRISTDDRALCACLKAVWEKGLTIVHGVPTVPQQLFAVVALFGYVRETNYGRLFDVKTVEKPTNLAFTSMKLGLHTDNPYRDPVPGLQLLHCLEASAQGGETLLCDGFYVAEKLRRDAPEAFALLTRWPVPFRFQDEDSDLQSRAPLIELSSTGEIEAVRYNNRSAAPLDLPVDVMADYYWAYRLFGEALHDPRAAVAYQLQPGDLLLFDNRRVLHARGKVGAGRRHLQGCYADMDGLRSKLSCLEAQAEARR